MVVVEISKDTCVPARTQCQLKPTEMLVRLLFKYDDDDAEGIVNANVCNDDDDEDGKEGDVRD